MSFDHVLGWVYGEPWLILPEKYDAIEAALARRLAAGPSAAADRFTRPAASHPAAGGRVAVIPIQGTITPRPSVFESGGTAADAVGRAVDTARIDERVSSIVLDIDSPGGLVAGVPELAAKIRQARDAKPVYAVANYTAASAAYWLASQATTIAVAPSGQVGSVGVVVRHFDESRAMREKGITITEITSGKYKAEGSRFAPLSDEARRYTQQQVDAIGDKFVQAVAAGRGLTAAAVRERFGQGRMMQADDAVRAGLADRVATFEQVLAEVVGSLDAAAGRARAARQAAAAVAGLDARRWG